MSAITIVVSLASGAVQTGLVKVKAQFQQLRNDLNSQFGHFLAFGAIAAGLKNIAEHADELFHTAKRFAVPVEELQRVTNAAKINGASMEDVARSWNKLAVNQQKAIEGNDEMRKVFEKLKIPMSEVVNLSVDQLFYRMADATKNAEDRGAAYAATVKLMGRNAGLLFATLEQGSEEIKKQGNAIGVMSTEAVEGFHRIHQGFTFLWGRISEGLGEAIVFFNRLIETAMAGADTVVQTFKIMGEAVTQTAKMLKSLVTGNIQNFDWQGYKNKFRDLSNDIVAQAQIAKKQLDSIWTPPKRAETKKVIDRSVEDSTQEVAKTERLVQLRDQLAEIERKTANDQLTIQGKINALYAQRAALVKEAAAEKDEEKKLQLEIDAAKVEQEITAAIKERTRFIEQEEKKLEKSDAKAIPANSLRRIGGQTQGGFAVSGVQDKILRQSEMQTKSLDDIAKNTKDLNKRELLMK